LVSVASSVGMIVFIWVKDSFIVSKVELGSQYPCG
jgi:hypothetical protein